MLGEPETQAIVRTAVLPAMLLLIVAASPVVAAPDDEDQWYEIEIIVFQHKDPESTESWPGDPGAPDVTDAVELAPAMLSPVQAELGRTLQEDARAATLKMPLLPFQLIDDSELRLGAVVNRLMLSDDYAPILHTAWRQPAVERDKSPAVHVQSEMPESPRSGAVTLNDLLVTPPGEELFGEALVETAGETPTNTIDGTITVSRNRYLHLKTDLLYHKAEAQAQEESGLFSIFSREDRQPDVFRMRQQRRIREGELHYFDHPMFGLIALVTPYETGDGKQGGEQGVDGR